MSYNLGPVKPWVRAAANEIGPLFGISTIGGYGKRPNPTDHDDGLALDFMTRKGGPLADYVMRNRARLGVTYVIWNQRINSGGGWRQMEDRGSDTANHKDHVHVSFAASAPAGFKGHITADSGRPPRGSAPQQESTIAPARRDGKRFATPGEVMVDHALDLALYGCLLAAGAGLIVVGIWRLSKPVAEAAVDLGTKAAALAGPEGAAIATAASAAKSPKGPTS